MESQAPSFVRIFNPIARRILNRGPLLGPNALITIRGRKSGLPRTTPVALVDIDGRRWVIGTFGEVNWVRNLRAAGRATVSVGSRRDGDTERPRAVSEYLIERMLQGGADKICFVISRWKFDILKDPASAAARRPVFELRSL